jgi:hypothetical protein
MWFWILGAAAVAAMYKVIGDGLAKGGTLVAKPASAATPGIQIDDVLMVNLSDPRIVHSPTTTMDFSIRPMRTISLTSVQGPDFIMVKKEATMGDPSEFILSVPRSAVVSNMRPTGGGFSF